MVYLQHGRLLVKCFAHLNRQESALRTSPMLPTARVLSPHRNHYYPLAAASSTRPVTAHSAHLPRRGRCGVRFLLNRSRCRSPRSNELGYTLTEHLARLRVAKLPVRVVVLWRSEHLPLHLSDFPRARREPHVQSSRSLKDQHPTELPLMSRTVPPSYPDSTWVAMSRRIRADSNSGSSSNAAVSELISIRSVTFVSLRRCER